MEQIETEIPYKWLNEEKNIADFGNGILYFMTSDTMTFGKMLSTFIKEKHAKIISVAPTQSGFGSADSSEPGYWIIIEK
jgi:hypothetical protein